MANLNYDLGENIMNVQQGSSNSKTGNSVQTWFIPKTMIEKGKFNVDDDSSVCFDCPMSKGNGCYVAKGFSRMGLNSKIKSLYNRGYDNNSEREVLQAISNQFVRFGSYGEPILLPLDMVKNMTRKSSNWTGYTHQWKTKTEYNQFFMASVSTVEEAMFAESLGWRYFLVIDSKEQLPENVEIIGNKLLIDGQCAAINCPASKESGNRTTCNSCGLCKGKSIKAKNIWIYKH
jgi:hypothetical protein